MTAGTGRNRPLLKGAPRSITGRMWANRLNPKGYEVRHSPTATGRHQGHGPGETTVLEGDPSGRDRPGTYRLHVNERVDHRLRTPPQRRNPPMQAGAACFCRTRSDSSRHVSWPRAPASFANWRTLLVGGAAHCHARSNNCSCIVQRAKSKRHPRWAQPPEHQPPTEAAQERQRIAQKSAVKRHRSAAMLRNSNPEEATVVVCTAKANPVILA